MRSRGPILPIVLFAKFSSEITAFVVFHLDEAFLFHLTIDFLPVLPLTLAQARLSLVPRLSLSACLAPLSLTIRPTRLVTPLARANPPAPPVCLFLVVLLLLFRAGMVTTDHGRTRFESFIVFVGVVVFSCPRVF